MQMNKKKSKLSPNS